MLTLKYLYRRLSYVMALSSANETKTAIVTRDAVTSGSVETTKLDAKEDREIVGLRIEYLPSLDGTIASTTEVYVGTRPTPSTGDANDNNNFYERAEYAQESDDTNGVGYSTDNSRFIWYGEGSGFDWNEDATLTLRLQNSSSSSASTQCIVVVHYREV